MFAGKSKWKSAPGKGTRKKNAAAVKQRTEAEQRKRKEEREQRKKGKGGSFSAAGGGWGGEGSELTSAEDSGTRFEERLEAFRARYGARAGAVVHGAWWLAHNCVAHPLLGLAPSPRTVALHDRTSDGLNLRAKEQASHSPMPEVGKKAWWVLHNCVAHPLIGVLPSALAFWLHDESAERMEVEGWV